MPQSASKGRELDTLHPIPPMNVNRSMRWFERRSTYVASTSFIDTTRYHVEPIGQSQASRFIERHHYLRTMPACQLCVGLFGPRTSPTNTPLVGVAIFAVPTTPNVIIAHSGLEPSSGTTLSRFVLLDDVPGNAETHFLSRAFRTLRRSRPEIEAVVSYADPNAGHIGHIYCAASAAHRGQSKPRTLWSIGATVVPGRTLTKIRKQERGHGTAIDRIVSLGAEPPSHGQTPAEWLASLPATGIVTPIRHPGHYIYNFPLTQRAKARSRQLPSVPYPTMSSLPFHPSKGPDR